MLRTLCFITLIASSTISHAHNNDNSLAHRAFWWSGNGTPVLDSFGNCIRNGSWEALGKPLCKLETAEVVTQVSLLVEEEVVITVAEVVAVEAEKVPVAVEAEVEAVEMKEVPTAAKTVVEDVAVIAPDSEPKLLETKTTSVMEPKPKPAVVTYSYPVALITANVYFDFDKNNLRVDQQEAIERAMIDARKANKIFKVSLGGYTDSVGTEDYNYGLSQRRINTVVNYLDLRGMQANSTMAWGENDLVINPNGSENYELSRRVEMVFKVQQKVAN